MVDDVAPYELMKLRLLNASHQGLAHWGRLLGMEYAHEAAADEDISSWVRAYLEREARATLRSVPGIDLDDYVDTLFERFTNEAIADTLFRLAQGASSRMPKFVLGTVRDNLTAGGRSAWGRRWWPHGRWAMRGSMRTATRSSSTTQWPMSCCPWRRAEGRPRDRLHLPRGSLRRPGDRRALPTDLRRGAGRPAPQRRAGASAQPGRPHPSGLAPARTRPRGSSPAVEQTPPHRRVVPRRDSAEILHRFHPSHTTPPPPHRLLSLTLLW